MLCVVVVSVALDYSIPPTINMFDSGPDTGFLHLQIPS